MITFVVVEDNDYYLNYTKGVISKYMMKNDFEYEIKTFISETKELKKIIKSGEDNNYIYILDFEIPGSSAIDIARLIRKEGDWRSPIIIFTVYTSMALTSFKKRLQILDYVSKKDKPTKNLNALFNICLEQLNCFDILKFKNNNIQYSIQMDKILYITRNSFTRKTEVVTNNKEYAYYIPLIKLKEKLPSYFIFTHKACITNMKKVETIDWTNKTITFDNGKTHGMITKTHKKGVDDYYGND